MAIINPPRELREKLGEAATDALVTLINQANEKQKEDILVFVEEKFERRLAEVKVELGDRIAEVRVELGARIEQTKSEIIKWMFIFWVGQIAVIAGLLFTLLKNK